jgi:hypothetical protein
MPPSILTNITDLGYSGVTCGGEWMNRSGFGYSALGTFSGISGIGNVTAGGYQSILGFQYWSDFVFNSNMPVTLGHYNDFTSVSPCNNVRVENFVFNPFNHSATTDNFDKFWEQYIWKTENGPTSPITSAFNLMSNGVATCKFVQTVTDRTVDYQFGYTTQTISAPGTVVNYPFYQCFPGVTYSPFVFQPRYSGNTAIPYPSISFTNVVSGYYLTRAIILGRFDALVANRINGWSKGTFTDPYQQTGELRAGITNTSRNLFASKIEDFVVVPNSPFSPMLQFLQGGLPITQNQYIRNVAATVDVTPYIGFLGATVPTAPAVATLDLIDTSGATGAGGAVLVSAAGSSAGMAAIKGSWTAGTGAATQGDLVVYTRPIGANPLAEAMRVQVAGNVKLTKPDIAAGTQTITGCSLTGAVGGSSAGKFSSGTTGTCTVTITPGLTAPNGYRCSATDLTTPADILSQTTGSTTTTCIISGTTASGDVITWQSIAY